MTSNNVPEGCKPFDRAMAKAGAELRTRAGRRVLRYADSEIETPYPIAAFIERSDTCDTHCEWITLNHEGLEYTATDTLNDIFLVRKKLTVWMNLYSNGDPLSCQLGARFYNSQEEAELQATEDRLGNKAYSIEIEEE